MTPRTSADYTQGFVYYHWHDRNHSHLLLIGPPHTYDSYMEEHDTTRSAYLRLCELRLEGYNLPPGLLQRLRGDL